MSEEVVYAIRRNGLYLTMNECTGDFGWGLLADAKLAESQTFAAGIAAEAGGEVVALVPLTDAQRRDLQAMEAMRETSLGAYYSASDACWVTVEPVLVLTCRTGLQDPADAILAVVAKLRREAQP